MTHDALETSIAESMGRFVSFPFEFFSMRFFIYFRDSLIANGFFPILYEIFEFCSF